jgi:phosphatidylglycerol---prolipoprotein diacylglyceryl transferase
MIEIGINRIAFRLGSIDIGWYGIMVTLAVITVVTWAFFHVRKDPRLTPDMIINAALVGIPSGIIFSRLMHIIDHWSYYLANPGKIIGGDGLSIWGAVLGAAIGIWLFSRINKKFSFEHLADVISPGIILAQAVGRVGCTLNGCCYGKVTDVPWAIVYTNPSSEGPIGIPVHPTQVYEIIFNLIVFVLLLLLKKRLKADGALFLIYLSLYSVWRIAEDFLRDGTPFLFGLHQAQVISIFVLAVAIPVLWIKLKNSVDK